MRATQVRPAHAARLRGAVPHVRALRFRLVQPRDCSWYRHCDLGELQDRQGGYRSMRVREER